MGEESMRRPPFRKKAFSTSTRWSPSGLLLLTLKVRDEPIPMTGSSSRVEGTAFRMAVAPDGSRAAGLMAMAAAEPPTSFRNRSRDMGRLAFRLKG